MSYKYSEIIDDLRRQILSPALASRAKGAIEELLQMHELDQSEIVRLRRQVGAMQEMTEGKALEEMREANRGAYRRKNDDGHR